MKITGIGNSIVDLFYEAPAGTARALDLIPGKIRHISWEEMDDLRKHLPQPLRMAGGSIANTMKFCSLLGLDTSLIMRTGFDPESLLLEDELKDNYVDLALERVHGRTGIYGTILEPENAPAVFAHPGSGIHLSADFLRADLIENSDYLFLEGTLLGNKPLMMRALSLAAASDTRVALDLCCPMLIDEHTQSLTEIIRKSVDLLFLNREEAASLTGKQEPDQILDTLEPLCSHIILKRDSEGVVASIDRKRYFKQTMELKPIDTTGAGDAFAAGYLLGLARGKEPRSCCEMGNFFSSRIISQIGTRITEEVMKDVENAFLSM